MGTPLWLPGTQAGPRLMGFLGFWYKWGCAGEVHRCAAVLERGEAPQPPPHTLHKTQQGPSRC